MAERLTDERLAELIENRPMEDVATLADGDVAVVYTELTGEIVAALVELRGLRAASAAQRRAITAAESEMARLRAEIADATRLIHALWIDTAQSGTHDVQAHAWLAAHPPVPETPE